MRKTCVLDTSVLIHDPEAITKFEDSNIVVPYTVVHELDILRKSSEAGAAARKAMRNIEAIRQRVEGDSPLLVNPQDESAPCIKFEDPKTLPVNIHELPSYAQDDMIIRCAAVENAIIVSKDIGLRVKASLAGVISEDYKHDRAENRYTGMHSDIVLQLKKSDDLLSGKAKAPDCLLENEFCYVQIEGYESVDPVLMRRKNGKLRKVESWSHGISGIGALDEEQRMALDVLMDDDVTCVVLQAPLAVARRC